MDKTHLRSLLHRLEREIKEFDPQIKEVRKAVLAALTLEEKIKNGLAKNKSRALESERGKRRRALFDAQDDIDRRRDQLIVEIEGKLQQKVNSEQIFALRWQVR